MLNVSLRLSPSLSVSLQLSRPLRNQKSIGFSSSERGGEHRFLKLRERDGEHRFLKLGERDGEHRFLKLRERDGEHRFLRERSGWHILHHGRQCLESRHGDSYDRTGKQAWRHNVLDTLKVVLNKASRLIQRTSDKPDGADD